MNRLNCIFRPVAGGMVIGLAAGLILVGAAAFPCTSFGGDRSIPRALLASAHDDSTLYQASSAVGSVPWLERLQLRLSGDDSRDSKKTYAARLYPKSAAQHRAESKILSLGSRRNALSYRVELNQTLVERYRLLVDLDLQQRQTDLLQREHDLTQASVQSLRKFAGSDEFRPSQLQSEELHLDSARDRLNLNRRRQQQLEDKVAALAGLPQSAAADIALPQLTAVADLEVLLTDLETIAFPPSDNTELRLAQIESEIERQHLQREKGRSGFGLDFMQLGVERADNADDVHKFTVGIDFPTGSSSFSTAQRQQKSNEAEYRMHRLHREQNVKKARNKAEIALLLTEYHTIDGQLAELNRRLGRQTAVAPVILKLELGREHIDAERRRAQLRHELYLRFVDQLALYGKLTEEPLRNWLAPDRPRL